MYDSGARIIIAKVQGVWTRSGGALYTCVSEMNVPEKF